MPARRITVIVTAYRRREFLHDAVASLRAQTLPRDAIELCVVSDFPTEHEGLDVDFPEIVLLHPDDPAEGRWIDAALSATRGEVVCFLDDDDRFEPHKLEEIARRFTEDPALGYLHHGFCIEGSESWARSEVLESFANAPMHYLPDRGKSDVAIAAMWGDGAAFNSSSVAIRRRILEGCAGDLREVRGGYSPFLFFAALSSHDALCSDPTILSRYRRHPGNESPTASWTRREWWRRSLEIAEIRAHDVDVVLRMVAARRPQISTTVLRSARAANQLLARLADTPASRTSTSRALRAYLREVGFSGWWSNRGLVGATMLAATIAPGLPGRLRDITQTRRPDRAPASTPR